MSGALNAILPGLPTGTWRDGMRQASFRGVPFHVESHQYQGGRRIAEHEYPLRDDGETEDLGRSLRIFDVEAFVAGNDYMAERDALLSACEESDQVGTLIHPLLGERLVRCMRVMLRETKDNGGVATFLLTFIEARSDESLSYAKVNTLSALMSSVSRVLRIARKVFAIYQVAKGDLAGFIKSAGLGLLIETGEYLAGRFLGLPGLDIRGTARELFSLSSSAPADAEEYSNRITTAIETFSLAGEGSVIVIEEGESFSSRSSNQRDPRIDAGKQLIKVWRSDVVIVVPMDESPIGKEVRNATADLTRSVALACAVQAFSLSDWLYAEEATAVRDMLIVEIDKAAELSAGVGDDEMFRAWRQLAVSVVEDFRERIQQSPRLVTYEIGRGLPALSLAHRLYSDASRANELVAITNAPHPAFLPSSGKRISP